MLSRLRAFDVYVKTMDGVGRKTTAGGAITVCSGALVSYLFLSLVLGYLRVTTTQQLRVDTSIGHGTIPLQLEINFPEVKCEHLSVDVEDQKGKSHAGGVESDVQKTPFGFGKKGCNVRGTTRVPKVKGVLSVGVGKARDSGLPGNNQHQWTFNYRELLRFDSSHHIKTVRFGDELPVTGFMNNTLDGTTEVTDKSGETSAAVQFLYTATAVPTTYRTRRGYEYNTFQLTSSLSKRRLDLLHGKMVHPGVTIQYDFSPMMVVVEERSPSLLELATSVFAIVGGVYAVAGMLDSAIDSVLVSAFDGDLGSAPAPQKW